MTIVDSDVWSEALRVKSGKARSWQVERLESLIKSDEVVMLGSIRQEALSGIRKMERFHKIKEQLRAFPDEALTSEDHERAAMFFNLCRSKGVQGSNTDFLICAYSISGKMTILTKDRNFQNYARYVPIELPDE